MNPERLFLEKGELKDFLEQREVRLKREVYSYDKNKILTVSEEDLCLHLISEYSLDTPQIHEDGIKAYEPEEADVYVRPSTVITIIFPFEGDGELFHYTPQTRTPNFPSGKIVGDKVHLTYKTTEYDTDKFKQMYQRDLNKINRYLEWVRHDVEIFNRGIEKLIRQVVSQRKKNILDGLGLVKSLGIPMERRENLPETYTIPLTRRKLKFKPPEASKEPFEPEPTLELEQYEEILGLIFNMSLVMERSPKTFSKLNEDEIRDHFLMFLNALYEGQATGETFNYGGKTDILIRVEGRNAFIAECKFWRGEKTLTEAMNQLLGYTSWRDTKTAILLFNKNRDFSSVLEKIDATVKAHSCYKREWSISDKLKSETIFSYVLHQPQDVNRE
ncbi:MAG: hypothetical protein ACETVN_00905, partial [Asgard group archaeon]